MNSEYKSKYLKYKLKYMALKKLLGGTNPKRKSGAAEAAAAPAAKKAAVKLEPRISQNGIFFILPNVKGDVNAGTSFYIRLDKIDLIQTYLDNKTLILTGKTLSFNEQDYNEVKAITKIDDPECLQLAEGMSVGMINYNEKICQFRVGKKLFGYRDTQNIELSLQYSQNENAAPIAGQAYGIVRQEIEADVPFHIAYVLIRDGNDTLTIETDAHNKSMTTAIFDMYTIGDREKSFHGRFKEIYTTQAIKKQKAIEPETIVLKPR